MAPSLPTRPTRRTIERGPRAPSRRGLRDAPEPHARRSRPEIRWQARFGRLFLAGPSGAIGASIGTIGTVG
jgi:hypothetical protein